MSDVLEIERRFLLSGVPDKLTKRYEDKTEVVQVYLPGEKIVERLAKISPEGKSSRYKRTVKIGHGKVRYEFEEPCGVDLFYLGLNFNRSRRIDKTCYFFKHGDLLWRVDDVRRRDKKRIFLAEIELEDQEQQVEVPEIIRGYLIREVTEDSDYEGFYLAK